MTFCDCEFGLLNEAGLKLRDGIYADENNFTVYFEWRRPLGSFIGTVLGKISDPKEYWFDWGAHGYMLTKQEMIDYLKINGYEGLVRYVEKDGLYAVVDIET